MTKSRTWKRVAGGAAMAAAVALVVPGETASARGGKKPQSGAMRMTDIDVSQFAGVAQNHIVTMKFTQPVDPSTVRPASLQVRSQNATNTGYTIDVNGTFQVAGSVIRFYPRLPTHLRDPQKTDGSFYQPGTFQDDASNNAGFQPSQNYQVTILGAPRPGALRSTRNRVLNRDYTARFTTAPSLPKSSAFDIANYSDAPPPAFQFSNPPDKVASAADLYARHGGTQDVPSAIDVTLFATKVPLSPASVRQDGNVTLTMLARRDNPLFTKPIEGVPSVEQNYDTTRLVFHPKFPLPDLGTFSLRVTKNVRDLSEVYDFKNNAERLRLRTIYEFLNAARMLSPGVPAAQFPDPPIDLIFDWPVSAATRGALKANILALGDNFPAEVDPRVMVLFTSRDEPVSHGQLTVNFLASEGLFDAQKSSADWDLLGSGVASGSFTFAGGDGSNGDLLPAAVTTISSDAYNLNTLNFRKVNIPANVVVNIAGTRPAMLKALDFQVDGSLRADGQDGTNVPSTVVQNQNININHPTPLAGGKGGPGGGAGGTSPNTVKATAPAQQSGSGTPGNDSLGTPATAEQGGRGGEGGYEAATTVYSYGGGAGGGGARTAGTAGAKGTYSNATWNGAPGQGGAAALGNADLAVLVGGAGGGAGGNAGAALNSYSWGIAGGSGGGGGGALVVQAASKIRIGATGSIRARGGAGGNGSGLKSSIGSGPGGGGGGGSLLLRSAKGFEIADLTKGIDVLGGPGGVQPTSGGAPAAFGGAGGVGFIRLESPTGGMLVAGGTAGTYAAVGAGLPSYVYSKFMDLGVDQPRIVNLGKGDFTMDATNDAILIEIQAAIEDPNRRGTPKITAIDANENSTNTAEVSNWLPLRLIDNTPTGRAFSVPGNTSPDAVFPIQQQLANKNYKFIRMRITFQMDDTQSSSSPVPYVDQIVFRFDFNF